MARGFGKIYRTPRCSCESPLIFYVSSRRGKLGKNYGKTFYTYRCGNCKAQWESLKDLGLKKG